MAWHGGALEFFARRNLMSTSLEYEENLSGGLINECAGCGVSVDRIGIYVFRYVYV
jgi:hypothetical protein